MIALLFVLLITGVRLIWINVHEPTDQPTVNNGQLNLSNWTFTEDLLSLNGEWSFYPNTFIETGDTDSNQEVQHIEVPGDWTSVLQGEDLESASYGYGSYKLTIRLPEDRPSVYGVRIKNLHNSARIVANGQVVKTVNQPSTTPEGTPTFRGPFYALFPIGEETQELNLVIEVSNYHTPYMGGINKSISFGTDQTITQEVNMQETLQLTVIIVLLLHALYAFLLFITRKELNQKELLLFGVMLIFMALGSALDDETFIQLPILREYSFRIMTFFYVCLLILMMQFIHRLYPTSKWFVRIVTVLVSVMAILTLGIVPFEHLSILLGLYYALYFVAISYMMYTTIQHIRHGSIDGYFILFFIISYTSNLVWGFLILSDVIDFPFYPFDFFFAILSIALLLFRRHHQLFVVSEQQRKKLIEEDQKKDQFLANTSHEIRNPLHAMINISQLLLNNHDELGDEAKYNLALIIRTGHQLTYTLNDILDITKIKENGIQLDKTDVNLHVLTNEVIEIVTFMSSKPAVHIENHIPQSLPLIHVDHHRMNRVLFNLLHNALKYTDEGTIIVDAHQKGNTVQVSVTDPGIGMSKSDVDKIFLPYEKLTTHDHDSGGIGLGLSITRQLIEKHGGKLQVMSKKGEGSEFSFILPLTTSKTKELAIQDTAASPLVQHEPLSRDSQESKSHAKILVIDDDRVNLNILKRTLEPTYQVTTTSNPEGVLDMLDKEAFDLIISDVMMPKLSGYQLTEMIREHFSISELPILLLTARSQPEDIYTGFLAGANDYIVKPVDSLELQARVQALTQLKQAINKQLQLEAAWLQAQIKPHFIFNTLNSIASLSTSDIDKMIDLLHVFGQYLTNSFSMSNTKTLVPLSEELELVESYLYINQIRFDPRIDYEIDVEEGDDIKTPPLIVQTLVENALKHGILKQASGGRIKILGRRLTSYYELQVIDNGVGMNDSIRQDILRNNIDDQHIGLANTNKRLKKLFNQQLIITSTEGEGTTITIQFPLHDE